RKELQQRWSGRGADPRGCAHGYCKAVPRCRAPERSVCPHWSTRMSNSKSFHVPNVTTHTMTSRYVQQTYEIRVMQPWMKVNAAERFPVLYLSDANLSFDFARGIAHCLQA